MGGYSPPSIAPRRARVHPPPGVATQWGAASLRIWRRWGPSPDAYRATKSGAAALLEHEFSPQTGILVVHPQGRLQSEDFRRLAAVVDPYLARAGQLRGVLIEAESFPGWSGFAALVSHFRFVKDHQRRVARVAAVTDSDFLTVLPRIANHFVRADVRHFPYDQRQAALDWLNGHTS